MSLFSQMPVEEFYNYVDRVFRLGNIHVVEEPVEQAFPNVEFGFDPEFYQLFVRVQCGAQFKTTSSRDHESRRKLRQNFRQVHRRDEWILRIRPIEIAERRTCLGRNRW